MAEEPRVLGVWCFERLAGHLEDAAGGPAFTYAAGWIDQGQPPLSQSLPLDGSFKSAAAAAFFGGLLPEGAPREMLARRLGVSSGNDFGLLAAIGGDTAGAISLRPQGKRPEPPGSDVEWLDDDGVTKLVDELPTRPMLADEDGEYRLSLAGVQDKLPVVVGPGGEIGLTKGQTPSTHILKTPIERIEDTVVNEAFCPALGRALGIEAVTAEPRRVNGRQFLLVARYDRHIADGTARRLHQEDFCQALGIPAERKYQSEGGPSLVDCFALVRGATAVPARETLKLLDYVALNFLVGNHDAHGKNYSLLYAPGTGSARLAPAYDLLSTVVYRKSLNLSRRMAMSIGGEYRPDWVRSRHLDRLLADAGLGVAAARRRLREHAGAAPAAAHRVAKEFAGRGWVEPIIGGITEIVEQRAAWLSDVAAPAPPATRRR